MVQSEQRSGGDSEEFDDKKNDIETGKMISNQEKRTFTFSASRTLNRHPKFTICYILSVVCLSIVSYFAGTSQKATYYVDPQSSSKISTQEMLQSDFQIPKDMPVFRKDNQVSSKLQLPTIHRLF